MTDVAIVLTGFAFVCWWLDRRRPVESRPTRADIRDREQKVIS